MYAMIYAGFGAALSDDRGTLVLREMALDRLPSITSEIWSVFKHNPGYRNIPEPRDPEAVLRELASKSLPKMSYSNDVSHWAEQLSLACYPWASLLRQCAKQGRESTTNYARYTESETYDSRHYSYVCICRAVYDCFGTSHLPNPTYRWQFTRLDSPPTPAEQRIVADRRLSTLFGSPSNG